MGPRKDRIVSSLFLFLPSFLFSFFFLPPISQCCIQRSQQTKILIGPDEKEKISYFNLSNSAEAVAVAMTANYTYLTHCGAPCIAIQTFSPLFPPVSLRIRQFEKDFVLLLKYIRTINVPAQDLLLSLTQEPSVKQNL